MPDKVTVTIKRSKGFPRWFWIVDSRNPYTQHYYNNALTYAGAQRAAAKAARKALNDKPLPSLTYDVERD